MSSPKEHIKVLRDEIQKMSVDKHIKHPDEFTAVNDIEIGIFALQKAFERNNYMGTENTNEH